MKKAGELLSVFFDEKTLTKAQGISKLFSSWTSIVTAHKIASAAAHSRVVELERYVILVEADHPGWIQILQTKQRELLHEFQRRFPDANITGIAFRLSRKPIDSESSTGNLEESAAPTGESEDTPDPNKIQSEEENSTGLYEKIKDAHLREMFKHLEQDIRVRNNKKGRKTR